MSRRLLQGLRATLVIFFQHFKKNDIYSNNFSTFYSIPLMGCAGGVLQKMSPPPPSIFLFHITTIVNAASLKMYVHFLFRILKLNFSSRLTQMLLVLILSCNSRYDACTLFLCARSCCHFVKQSYSYRFYKL